MHNLICGFCSSDQRFAHGLVCSPYPASFRFHLSMDTLAFGYILPTTGRIRNSHSLETCAARRTPKRNRVISKCTRFLFNIFINCKALVFPFVLLLYMFYLHSTESHFQNHHRKQLVYNLLASAMSHGCIFLW